MIIGAFGGTRICLNQVTEAERLAREPYDGEIVYQTDGIRGIWIFTPDGWVVIAPDKFLSKEEIDTILTQGE